MKIDCAYDEMVSIESLKPHPKNNNRHSDEQINRLAKIIKYQGMRSPIVVSRRSNCITKGHARWQALKELAWPKVPVDYQDYESDEQEYADITADNEIARWAKLDMDLVYTELKAMPDFDVDLLGIEEFKLEPMDLPEIDLPEEESEKLKLEVKFDNQMECQDLFDDLTSKGYLVKMI